MLDIQAELHEAGQPYQELYEAVVDLKRRHDLHPCAVRPRDGLSLRNDGEREQVQDLVSRFRRLPEDTRRRLPALWNSLAQLEVVIGDIEASLSDFQEIAGLVEDPISRAEAHHNAYRAALERKEWETALAALRRAIALDPETFEPFPMNRFEPRKILGAGGFGVSFLCMDRQSNETVVVKALRTDSIDRDTATLFRELKILQEIDHPALVRILDMGQMGQELPRPYLVMELVEGMDLGDFIAHSGPLSHEDWLDVCWPIARALQALHGKGVLHRSLRPDCILIRRTKNKDGMTRLAVKCMDVGLGFRRAVIHACASNPETLQHTALGRSVANLLHYAPTEVTGRPKGQVWVGPHSDIYHLARLCLLGLTGRPDADLADRLLLPEAWRRLLDSCTGWTINSRPAHMGLVLEMLAQTPGADQAISRIERDLHESTIDVLSQRIATDPDNLNAYLQRAGAWFRQGSFDQAIRDYTEALRLRPDDAGLYRKRALAYTRNSQPSQAVADYTEALRLEPRNLEALANRGLGYAQMGDHDHAIADYSEGLRLNPRDEALLYNRGNAHYCKGNFAQAIADYTETLRIDSRSLWALGNRGKAYLIEEEPARALADFTRLLSLDPTNVKALCDRASAHLDLGRPDRAVGDYTLALRLEPSAALYHDRGLANILARNIKGAIEDFTQALELSPDNAAVLLSRARANADLGETDQALADYTEVLRIAPQSAAASQQRGQLLARLGRTEEALADFTMAITVAPEGTAGYFQRGLLYAEKGDHDRAIADFSEVIRLEPDSAGARTNRGNSLARLGDLDQAIADYNEAILQMPDDTLTLMNRAAALARLGNVEAALADHSRVLELEPDNARAFAGRGVLLASQGEVDRALADLDQAIRRDPTDARVFHQRGNLHAERGDLDKAIADFSEALALVPEYALAWYNRGIAHGEKGNHEAAAHDFGEAARLDESNIGAIINRGIALRALGEREAALEQFSLAIERQTDFVVPYYNRANLRAEAGDLDGALEDLGQVLRLQPDDVGAYLSRGRIHSMKGDLAGAIADNLAARSRAPDDARVANNLAWLWATSPGDLARPQEALELARAAVAAGEDATRLDTLAAALAACKQFTEAIEVQKRAMELASEEEKLDFQRRLEMYEEELNRDARKSEEELNRQDAKAPRKEQEQA